MKLKTLKDLENFNKWPEYSHVKLISDEELKKEAIKWVKELRKPLHMYDKFDTLETIAWIMEFFNITEEDLF